MMIRIRKTGKGIKKDEMNFLMKNI